MKASDLSPRLLSFHWRKNHVGGGGRRQWQKGWCHFLSKNISSPHQVPFTCTFFKLPFLFSLTSNLFASGATLAWLPHLTKGLVFPFLLLFCFFWVLSREKWTFLFYLWLAWCVFIKSACQPYLPASLTVPFWRRWCTATRRLARLAQSLDLTIALFFISVSSLTLRGAFLGVFDAASPAV